MSVLSEDERIEWTNEKVQKVIHEINKFPPDTDFEELEEIFDEFFEELGALRQSMENGIIEIDADD